MASASGGMTGPFWSVEAQEHYWYDEVHDHLVFQTGRRVRRPETVPRASLMTPPQLQYEYSGSPPGPNAGYTSSARRPAHDMASPRSTVPNPSSGGLTAAFGNLTVAGPSPQQYGSTNSGQPESYTGPDGVTTHLQNIQEGKIVKVFNPKNQVATVFKTGPSKEITDPQLLQNSKGKGAYRMLMNTGSEGDTEQLFASFKVRSVPRKFFTIGTVFMVLWSEPAGEQRTLVTEGVSARTPGITRGTLGEKVFSKVRRFVVIREASNYCSALPITTYSSQGVGKAGVTKAEHAIIYTGKKSPTQMASEEPVRGEQGMRPDCIRVDPDDREDKLDPRSRIDFGKVHTIQHNIKVKSFGRVNDKYMQALQKQFNLCWYAQSVPMVSPTSPPPPVAGSSRVQTDTRAPAATRRESVSSGKRSRPYQGSGSGESQSGQHRPQGSTPRGDDGRDPRSRPDERGSIARLQERQRQQYWDAVDQLVERTRCTREAAMEAINARLAQRRVAARSGGDDDDDNDDDDDDDDDEEN